MSTYELLPGTLDLLILKAASLGPLHGYGILLRIEQLSGESLRVPQGSMYPALHRLERGGLLKTTWGTSDNNRRAKYYELTPRGAGHLDTETTRWQTVAEGVGRVLAAEVA